MYTCRVYAITDSSTCKFMYTCFYQDNISDSVIQKIQPYIDNEDFTPQAILKVYYILTFCSMVVINIKGPTMPIIM